MANRNNKKAFYFEFDTNNFLAQFDKKIEDFGGKGGAIERTVNRLVPLLKAEYESVIASFKNPTGTTEESLMDAPELKWKGNEKLTVKYGFKISKGGLASIFINYGRPGIKYKNGTVSKPMQPVFFIENTVNKYVGTFNEIFKEEVLKELGGLL